MENKSTLYSYAVVAQPIHEKNKYLWQKVGKYKQLKNAEQAIFNFTQDKIQTLNYKIVPYFEGYWFTDNEVLKHEYIESNFLLWEFLSKMKLVDEAREHIKTHKK